MDVTLHWIVRGRVQGVGFRYATVQQAARLGLTGWVRNRRDSSVEVVACGTADNCATLADWLARGPATARVDGIDERAATTEESLRVCSGFESLPTG
jgi:acylphosphatase